MTNFEKRLCLKYSKKLNFVNSLKYFSKIFEMDKRPIGYQAGKTYALDKKVPKTNKYDHVESKLAGKIGTTAKDVQFASKKISY